MQSRYNAAAILALTLVFLLSPTKGAFAFVNNEARIREYFFDIPVMVSIAKCESTYRQYTASGAPFYNASGTYIGAFQIHASIHTATAISLGFDIATLEGNMGYARYLYNRQGTGPWKGCLPKTSPTTPKPSATTTPSTVPAPMVPASPITLNFNVGAVHPQILSVQKLLNSLGFTIAASGPGSTGRETSIFGTLTKIALQRFQCAQKIACSGDAWSTGYGRIGPRTRAALNRSL